MPSGSAVPMTDVSAASPELYFDTIFAYQRAAALKSALDLDLFTAIADGAHTAAEVATGCHAPVRGVRILCDYLTTIGFLAKSEDRYELTPDTATFLSRRSPAYVGDTAQFLYSPKLVGYFDRLTQTIRRAGSTPTPWSPTRIPRGCSSRARWSR